MYDDTLVTRYAGVDPPVPMVQADALKEKILYLTKELAQKDRELQVAAHSFCTLLPVDLWTGMAHGCLQVSY